jgi:RNA polymerase sigma-70 factor (ECF subfamily)
VNKRRKSKLKKILHQRSFTTKDFEPLYELFHGKVYNFVLRRVSSKEIAEDITSEIFEKIYKSLPDFQWQGVTISAWIFRIARNAVIDHYRKNSKRKNDASIDDFSNSLESPLKKAEDLMIEREEHVILYDAIREFPDQDQYLIFYKFFEELSNKDIAKLMKMSETNVGTRLHRVRRKLGKIIAKER